MKEKSAARSDRTKIAEKVLHVEPTQPTPVEEARQRQPPSTCQFGNHSKGRAPGQNCIVQVKLKPPSKEFKIGQAVRCPVEFQMEQLESTTRWPDDSRLSKSSAADAVFFPRILADRFIIYNGE